MNVADFTGSTVLVTVAVAVFVGAIVRVVVAVAVDVGVGVEVFVFSRVAVAVAVLEDVAVRVAVAVRVIVGVEVDVGVWSVPTKLVRAAKKLTLPYPHRLFQFGRPVLPGPFASTRISALDGMSGVPPAPVSTEVRSSVVTFLVVEDPMRASLSPAVVKFGLA